MGYLVEFPLEGGESVIVEMTDDQLGGFTPAAVEPGEITTRATESFERAVDQLIPLVSVVWGIARRHDELAALTAVTSSVTMRDLFASERRQLLPSLIGTLANLEEYELALQELDEVDPELSSPELDSLHGSVLSTAGRDTEALVMFGRALEGDLSDDARYRTLSDYGLSLKRLGRYDEAVSLYRGLLGEVPEAMIVHMQSNLGGVLIEAGQAEDAFDLLQPAAAEHPESGYLWANLGQAQEKLGRYTHAARSYGRALSVAPEMTSVLVLRARLYLQHLGRVAEAAGLLEQAYEQGCASLEWHVLMRSCALLLGWSERAEELIAAAERDLPPETVRATETAIDEIICHVRMTGEA